MHVMSTAGHVDHGKSSLVRALTGVDPDRWAEEKARGLTIDLGFGSATLPSGRGVSLIDVPGHVRFLKNMLAGVGAVDACLFVVAATEGWKPQSEEHLRILEVLDLRHGLIVLTKVGLADDDLRELAHLDVEEHVAGTFLEGAPIIEVDTVDDIGLDDLRLALDEMLDATPTALDIGRPRLWIDRAFAAKGAGTVVTGTLAGGKVRVDDALEIWPGPRSVRVRGIQTLHAERTKIGPGNRAALNLSGVSREGVGRGDVLVAGGQWRVTSRVDASLQVLDSLGHVVSRRGAYVAYIGAGEHSVKLRILGPSSIQPGQSGLVRLHLPIALPLVPGDRFVLRESGRNETVGGGEILDVAPVLPASRAKPDRSVERVVAERGWVDAAELTLLTGQRATPTVDKWVVDPARFQHDRDALRAAIAGAGHLGLELAALDERSRAVLATLDDVVIDGGHVRPADSADPLADHPFVAALGASLFSPPDPVDVDRAELRELVRHGQVVDLGGVFYAAEVVPEAASRCAKLLAKTPEGFTVADFRDEVGSSRKHTLPLLGHLDETGVTRRRGDLRIGGPRLPTPD